MSSRFCVVKRFDVMYADFVPPERRPLAYAHPAKGKPRFRYLGLGREERDLYDTLSGDIDDAGEELIESLEDDLLSFEEIFSDEEETEYYASLFDDADAFEIMWLRDTGDSTPVPPGYVSLGYDVSYHPEGELFSAVADLFFFPVWHGADPSGKDFETEFASLNPNGLFSSPKSAEIFRAHYCSVFAESGLVVCEVFARQ